MWFLCDIRFMLCLGIFPPFSPSLLVEFNQSPPIPSHPRVPKTRASGYASAPTSDHSFSNRQIGPSFPKITWTVRGKHVALSGNSSFYLRCYCSVKSVKRASYASVTLTYDLCYLQSSFQAFGMKWTCIAF